MWAYECLEICYFICMDFSHTNTLTKCIWFNFLFAIFRSFTHLKLFCMDVCVCVCRHRCSYNPHLVYFVRLIAFIQIGFFIPTSCTHSKFVAFCLCLSLFFSYFCLCQRITTKIAHIFKLENARCFLLCVFCYVCIFIFTRSHCIHSLFCLAHKFHGNDFRIIHTHTHFRML